MPQNTYVAPVITASGTTWAQLKAGGVPAVLANMATTNAAKANPTTTATVVVGGSGGLLAAGDYYAKYSWCDAFGETLAGGVSAVFTVGSGEKPVVTIPALPTGVMSANIYLTPADGAAGTETLYATGITATTFSCDYAAPLDRGAALPTVNTTGFPPAARTLIVSGRTELSMTDLTEYLSHYLSGGAPNPPDRRATLDRLARCNGILSAWSKAYSEAAALVAANPPTALARSVLGTGMPSYKWTFP